MTGCYGPLLLGTCERLGAVIPRIELAAAPAGLLSLVSDHAVCYYNGSAHPITCRWRPHGAAGWNVLSLPAAAAATTPLA